MSHQFIKFNARVRWFGFLFVSRLKSEDVEKKLREAEQREETYVRRISEKDKTIAKMK